MTMKNDLTQQEFHRRAKRAYATTVCAALTMILAAVPALVATLWTR